MFSPTINNTQHLNYKKKISGPLIVGSGFVISIVATFLFTAGWCNILDGLGNIESLIMLVIVTGVGMHCAISIYCNASFLRGLKEHDPSLFIPWFWIRGIEIAALVFGSIATCSYVLTPIGIIFMIAAMHLFSCVWKTYEEIKKNFQIPFLIQNSPYLDKPPSYDELELDSALTNQ